MVKIVTWNLNSIRSRINIFLDYLKKESPDIILLQEIKCQDNQFPYLEIEDIGYNVEIVGQKTYNGVAIISKYPISDIRKYLYQDEEARYIEGLIHIEQKVIRVASVYVPNGYEVNSNKFNYKMDFLDNLIQRFIEVHKYNDISIFGGDYNIAPYKEAMYDYNKLFGSLCCHIDEIKKFRELCNVGYQDAYKLVNGEKQEFTWWDYRKGARPNNHGLRIDHLLLSPEACDLLNNCYIDDYVRDLEKPSDHAPVVCCLD